MKISSEQEKVINEIHYQLLGGSYFPMDPDLYSYIPLTLSRLPKDDLDYILYDLKPIVIQICANTVFKIITVNKVVVEPTAYFLWNLKKRGCM